MNTIIGPEQTARDLNDAEDRRGWIVIGVLSLIIVISYLNSLHEVSMSWDTPQYSHGYLIPLFTAVLLWIRREPLSAPESWEVWSGVGLIVASLLIRVIGTHYVLFTVDRISLIPCLAGVFLMVGGLSALRWAGPPLLFLFFMLPLPGVAVDNILRPLKTIATQASNYALQTLGYMTFRDGNRIVVDNLNGEAVQLGVVDACSGLRMVTIFTALCVAFAMLTTHRPLWERIVIVMSAIPIALFANVLRITLTGIVYSQVGNNKMADWIVHDAAGFLMIPIALGLLYLEYQVLLRIFIEDEDQSAITVGVAKPA